MNHGGGSFDHGGGHHVGHGGHGAHVPSHYSSVNLDDPYTEVERLSSGFRVGGTKNFDTSDARPRRRTSWLRGLFRRQPS